MSDLHFIGFCTQPFFLFSKLVADDGTRKGNHVQRISLDWVPMVKTKISNLYYRLLTTHKGIRK